MNDSKKKPTASVFKSRSWDEVDAKDKHSNISVLSTLGLLIFELPNELYETKTRSLDFAGSYALSAANAPKNMLVTTVTPVKDKSAPMLFVAKVKKLDQKIETHTLLNFNKTTETKLNLDNHNVNSDHAIMKKQTQEEAEYIIAVVHPLETLHANMVIIFFLPFYKKKHLKITILIQI